MSLRRLPLQADGGGGGQLFGQAPAPPMWRRSPTESASAIGRAARLHFRPRKPGASVLIGSSFAPLLARSYIGAGLSREANYPPVYLDYEIGRAPPRRMNRAPIQLIQ